MYIVFHPALSETNHIPINSGSALLNFSATLDVDDYRQLERDGGRVQLWSDIPSGDPSAPHGEWTSCDFRLDAAACGSDLSCVQDKEGISLSLVDDEDLSSPESIVNLTLQLLVPPFGKDQGHFSYTYRIMYPAGEIRWLGEFGQNGALVCEHATMESILGLVAGWTCEQGVYTWTDRITRMDAPVLRLAKPDGYFAWTVGSRNGAFLTILVARRKRGLVSVPPEFILCASPESVMHVRPEKTITFTGDGSLVMSSFPRLQSDLSLLKNMILQHCSPERVTVTLAGKAREHMMITTRNILPVEGITITTRATPLSIPTDTLRSFLSCWTLGPFLLFCPQTLRAHLVTDPSTVTFVNAGPFVLCPAFNMRSRVYVSILSPHRSAELVEIAASNLPTPPPSPDWIPRSLAPPRLDSSDETALSRDVGNVNDQSSYRLCLRAVAMRTRCLFVLVWTVVYELIFGKSNAENETKEDASDGQSEAPEEPVTSAVDTQAGGLEQKDFTSDSDSVKVIVPSEISGNERPRVVWVEIEGSSTVRLAVCGSAGINAEMNGTRVAASRTSGTGLDVEFWEVAVDVGGMLRVSYDDDMCV